jgi:hypothetical protein
MTMNSAFHTQWSIKVFPILSQIILKRLHLRKGRKYTQKLKQENGNRD